MMGWSPAASLTLFPWLLHLGSGTNNHQNNFRLSTGAVGQFSVAMGMKSHARRHTELFSEASNSAQSMGQQDETLPISSIEDAKGVRGGVKLRRQPFQLIWLGDRQA
jgi:hypothetical protein